MKRMRARSIGESFAVMGDTAGREMERSVEGVWEEGVSV